MQKVSQVQKVYSIQDHPLTKYFPVKPYFLQLQISSKIIEALQTKTKKIIIIQSPTGTGKTYSLLVGILPYLHRNRYTLNLRKQDNQQKSSKKIPAFLLKKNPNNLNLEQNLKNQRQQSLKHIISLNQVIKTRKNQNYKISTKKSSQNQNQSQRINIFDDLNLEDLNEQKISNFDPKNPQKYKRSIDPSIQFELKMKTSNEKTPIRIYFVSRSHSQLSQVMNSLQKVIGLIKLNCSQFQSLRCVHLGSKNLLCSNSEIKASVMEENSCVEQKCMVLLNKKGCPNKVNSEYKIEDFLDKPLEETIKISSEHGICGYYGLRNLIDCADVLLVPYSSIVSPQVRARIGINCNNSIVVFDEGHNLLEFIKESKSCAVSMRQIQQFSSKTTLYLGTLIFLYIGKYGKLMKVQNKHVLDCLVSILDKISLVMEGFSKNSRLQGNESGYLKLSLFELIVELNLRQIKLHQIKSLLMVFDYDKKISFYQPQPQLKTHHKIQQGITVAQIHKIITWIQLLYSLEHQNIIAIIKKAEKNSFHQKLPRDVVIKLHCFHTNELQNIIQQSRLTIVAGGTMQPLDDFSSVLQKYPNTIIKVGHIVKPQQCKIKILTHFQYKQISFNHKNFTSSDNLSFLKRVCLRTIKIVVSKTQKNQGIIIFIQKYQLIDLLREVLKSQEFYENVLFDSQGSLGDKKIDIFELHSKRVKEGRRSILITVMGGKLSEGINFSDDLARKLIVFGLPYPNIKAPEIVEQMKYYDDLKLEDFNGQKYYEGLCLKTVNQTIGRAIRHSEDWAEIFLIDRRFQGVEGKLSEWMRRSIEIVKNLEELEKDK